MIFDLAWKLLITAVSMKYTDLDSINSGHQEEETMGSLRDVIPGQKL